jgi:predicted permease
MPFFQDLRYSFRNLGRAPGFALLAVITLALGIGANTAIFSVLHAVLLQPLPYGESDRIVTVWETFPMAGSRGQGTLCFPRFVAWREQNQAFDSIAMGEGRGLAMSDNGDRIAAFASTADLFRVLDVKPLHGRTFRPDEDLPGRPLTAVLSYGFWQRRFGGNPDIVNRRISLRDGIYTVVGIMPKSFTFPAGSPTDAWVPLQHSRSYSESHQMHTYFGVARLRPGVSVDRAAAEMATLTRHLETGLEERDARGVQIIGLMDHQVGNVRPVIWLLFGAVSLVLLIACVNVSNLLLARNASRRTEVAIRAALGAGRGRMISQLLAESLLLAAAGAGLGVALAAWLVDLLRLVPYQVPRLDEAALSGPVLAFAVAAALLSAALFGILPAFHATRLNLNDTLKDGSRGSSGRGRTRSALVVAEVGLTIVLLVGATLLVRSLMRLQSVPAGFDTKNLLTFRVPLVAARYPTNIAAARFYDRLSAELRQIPGITAVGAISRLPPNDYGSNGTFDVEGLAAPNEANRPFAEMRFITPGYLPAMGIPLVKGRMFTDGDRDPDGPCPLLVNETFVRRYLRDMDPIGRKTSQPCTIVGVIGDVRNGGIANDIRPEIYMPVEHAGDGWRQDNLFFVARTAVDPGTLGNEVRNAVRSLDAEGRVAGLQSMDEAIAHGFAQPRFRTLLIGAFAALAMTLSLIGLYGVISYEVTQRVREIGIRMALGAEASGVLRLVIGRGLRLAGGGLLLGTAAALALVRVIGRYLYQLSPFDPVSFAIVAAIIAAVAVTACVIPAWRAVRVDPTIALRYE